MIMNSDWEDSDLIVEGSWMIQTVDDSRIALANEELKIIRILKIKPERVDSKSKNLRLFTVERELTLD